MAKHQASRRPAHIPVYQAKPFESRSVCVLTPSQAEIYKNHGIEQGGCASGNHRHLTRSKLERLIDAGEYYWVGKGKNKVAPVVAQIRSFRKVYNRNAAGETISCGLQLVHGV